MYGNLLKLHKASCCVFLRHSVYVKCLILDKKMRGGSEAGVDDDDNDDGGNNKAFNSKLTQQQ